MADEMNRDGGASGSPAESARALATDTIIDRFGGVRPMAGKLGLQVDEVQGWRKRGFIPQRHAGDLATAAAAHGIALTSVEIEAAILRDADLSEQERRGLAEMEKELAAKLEKPADKAQAAPPPLPPPPPAAASVKPAAATTGSTATKPASLTPPPRSGGKGLAGTAFILSLAALGVAGYGQWQMMRSVAPVQEAPAPVVDIEPLQTELAAQKAANASNRDALVALTARLAALEAQPTPPSPAPEMGEAAPAMPAPTAPDAGVALPDLEPLLQAQRDLAARLDRLEQAPGQEPADLAPVTERIAALEQQAGGLSSLAEGQVGLREQILALTERVQALESRRQQASAGEGLVVAIGRLHSALVSGRPYERELRAVKALAADQPALQAELAPLEASAGTGLTGDVALHQQFRDLAPEILRADRTRSDASWTDQALGRLSSIITVRRADGDVAGDGTDALLARAEAALAKGDIAQAVAEVGQMQGPAATVAAPWLAQAQARVAADQAASRLSELTLSRLSGGEEQPQ